MDQQRSDLRFGRQPLGNATPLLIAIGSPVHSPWANIFSLACQADVNEGFVFFGSHQIPPTTICRDSWSKSAGCQGAWASAAAGAIENKTFQPKVAGD
jgi:hypothetical protein